MSLLRTISLVLIIVGAINWGLVGLMNLDLVALLFGDGSLLARIVYILVGLAGVAALTIFPVVMGRRHTDTHHLNADANTTVR